jgi:S1-C subfamily serine protease
MPRQPYVAAADASAENVSIGFGTTDSGRRVTLGVVPDYTSTDTVTGVRISGTTPGTPDDKAGLKDGDIIVKLGQTDIESLQGLSAALMTAEPNKPTSVTIVRAGQRIELPVTLVEKTVP